MRESTISNEPLDIVDPTVDVLEEGITHKVMVFFHIPSRWPNWGVAGAGILLALLAGWIWWLVVGDWAPARDVFLVQMAFLVADTAVLIALPKMRLSFGPWKSQLAALTIPRLLATTILALATSQVGVSAGFGLLLAVHLLGTAALVWGSMVEPFRLSMSELVALTDKLPIGLPPLRILHITDLHIERWTRREEEVLQIAQDAKPDLIVLTGDYVNLSYQRDPETHDLVRCFLNRLSAPLGVYATLGSSPVDLRAEVAPIFEGTKVKLLRQSWHHIDLPDGRKLTILGVDCTHHIPTDAARLFRLISSAPANAPQLLLYHSPELMLHAATCKIDLYLCGHTHGGQVRLPLVGPILTSSKLGRRFVMGAYRLGRTQLYVSRGVGLEGMSAPRVRFMAPPEVTLVTLMPGGPGEYQK